MRFDLAFSLNLIPIMFKYLQVTISLAFFSICMGLILSFFIAIIIDAKIPVLHQFFKTYIAFFRGTPLIAQLFCVYFGVLPLLPNIMTRVSSYGAAFIVLSLNSAAYMAESLRGAISSIDYGQKEAAYSIGMSSWQTMRRIILPQAYRVALPTLTSSFINVFKDTALAFSIGVKEMMATAQLEAASSYRYLEAFVDVLLIYWIITYLLTLLLKTAEKKFNSMAGVVR